MAIRRIRPTAAIFRVRDPAHDFDIEANGKTFFRRKEDAELVAEKAEQQFGWPLVVKRYWLQAEDGGR